MNVEDQDKHCLWLKRDIDDIEEQQESYALSRYIGKLKHREYSLTLRLL